MATLISGLGGTAGYGENSFSLSAYTGTLDDGSVNVDLTSVFGTGGVNLYGTSYSSVYINTNGLLTFGAAEPGYTPGALTSLGQPSIAPFWTDIDISKGGEIYWDLDPSTGKLTVTWLNVAPYSGSGTNSFQVVLSSLGGGDVAVEYVYGSIGFTNGGFGAATVGVSNGTSSQTLVEGSGDPAFLAGYAGNDFDTNDAAGVFSMAYEAGQPFFGDGVVDGTAGGDLINGAYASDPDGDRIDALDGTGYAGTTGEADYVLAGAGNDTVQSALGNDIVYGGAGNDQITAGQGNDWADGGTENDSLDGGSGHDTLYGGTGSDTLIGGADSAATTYTAAYVEITSTTQAVSGTSGRPNFSVRSISDETLITGSNGTLSGFRLGDLNAVETHSHIASSPVSGGEIRFNGINSNETLTISIDGVVQNLNTAIASGAVSFSGALVYEINAAGQIVRIGSAGSTTTVGTLTINVPYTTVSLASAGSTSGSQAGLWYEYYVNTQPSAVAAASGGNDVLYGEAGADSIEGGNGNDSLYGGDDNDSVYGGDGDDWADLGNGDDLFGTYGADSGGNDTVYGGAGNDSATGGGQDDRLYGGTGNDTLSGGVGNDRLEGGDGADSFWITDDHQGDTILGGEGGTDNDLIGFGNYLTAQGVNVTFSGNEAGSYVFAGAAGTNGSFSEIEAIAGTIYADQINASAATTAAVTLYGNAGNDTLQGGGANDSLYGGNDNDVVAGNGGQDLLFGEAGADSLSGGDAADTLYGGADGDTLNGDAGNDLLWGEDGADVLFGGAGVDTLYGGIGADVLSGGTEADLIYGGADGDTLNGDAGNDQLFGEAGADSLSGGDEADTLYGGADGDTLNGDAGDDLAYGGDGNDAVNGGTGNDTLHGDLGDDTLTSDSGNDLIYGGDGNDAISSGADNDTIIGDAGADTITAGQGMDWVDYAGSTAGVTVDLAAGTGLGGLAAGDVLSGVDALLGSAYDDALYGFDGFSTNPADAYTNIFFGNAGNDLLDGRGGDDSLYGGADNDTVLGGGGADLVDGGSGNDSLEGGAGADTLLGGAGNDTLVGGADADSIDGGADQDTIIIGAGSDGYGDTVAGGETGSDSDVLDLTAWGWALTNIIYDPMDPENGTVEFLDSAGVVIGSMSFSGIEQVIPCFTPGTRITTDRGEVLVEDLRAGDRVMTRDHGVQTLRWVGRRDLSLADLIVNPALRPVEIAQGALGQGLPLRNMKVSPQHRMLIEGARSELLFGEPEVLVAATHLTALPGVAQKLTAGISYIHLLFAGHEIIRADGAWTESFQPATRMVGSMEAAQQSEIAALFPEIEAAGFEFPEARLSLKAHEARVLLAA